MVNKPSIMVRGCHQPPISASERQLSSAKINIDASSFLRFASNKKRQFTPGLLDVAPSVCFVRRHETDLDEYVSKNGFSPGAKFRSDRNVIVKQIKLPVNIFFKKKNKFVI